MWFWAAKKQSQFKAKQSHFAGHLNNFNGEHFWFRGYAVYAIGKIRANRNETMIVVKPSIASRGFFIYLLKLTVFESNDIVSHSITTIYTICHSRGSGNPLNPLRSWIPAFAGMTTRIGQFELLLKRIYLEL